MESVLAWLVGHWGTIGTVLFFALAVWRYSRELGMLGAIAKVVQGIEAAKLESPRAAKIVTKQIAQAAEAAGVRAKVDALVKNAGGTP